MKKETSMTKLTPAQAYAAQVRADRRAAALERREGAVAGDNERVAEMFANAAPQPVKKPAGRARFASGTIRELPTENGAVKTVYSRDEFHLLPPAVRELIAEIDPLWLAETGFVLPGVALCTYRADKHLTWWIAAELLEGNLPPMYTTANKLTRALPKKATSAYRYHTASLLKVAERLRSGRPVFAYDEAIDRLLAD
jgi:hypothetical protein